MSSDRRDDDGTDAVWRREEVDSPCQKICVVHPSARLCVGCHRSPEEIAGWSRYSADERARITAELPGRGAQLREASRETRRRARAMRERVKREL